jgi:hypothetical protein
MKSRFREVAAVRATEEEGAVDADLLESTQVCVPHAKDSWTV